MALFTVDLINYLEEKKNFTKRNKNYLFLPISKVCIALSQSDMFLFITFFFYYLNIYCNKTVFKKWSQLTFTFHAENTGIYYSKI